VSSLNTARAAVAVPERFHNVHCVDRIRGDGDAGLVPGVARQASQEEWPSVGATSFSA